MSFARNLFGRFGKKRFTKTVLESAKTASIKVVHETAEATGKITGNKIAENIVKPTPVSDEHSRNIEEIVIPPEKRQEILNIL